jgi:hypothetical protein
MHMLLQGLHLLAGHCFFMQASYKALNVLLRCTIADPVADVEAVKTVVRLPRTGCSRPPALPMWHTAPSKSSLATFKLVNN